MRGPPLRLDDPMMLSANERKNQTLPRCEPQVPEGTLAVTGLALDGPRAPLVEDAAFTVSGGEIAAITGPSGSGKSLTCLAVLGLLPAAISARGQMCWDGRRYDLADPVAVGTLRGRVTAGMPQDATAALTPVRRRRGQIIETLRVHNPALSRRDASAAADGLADAVGLDDARTLLDRYPHQLSGGQNQRMLAALALATPARIICVDEPTSALDPDTAEGLMRLFRRLADDQGLGILMISHDLRSVDRFADRVYAVGDQRISRVR